ncbi:MAG: leucyl/phenylalanyl-tRNA--protein transferase [Desulfobacterales bacterium]|nr:leucyl/phenylalanyl-tRNA--protein transferase [Desulfobacterales bacterium]
MPVFMLSDQIEFPPARLARQDGLLAVGGDLSAERLLLAYRMGIFPWYSGGEPILWWSPDPRLVLYPAELKISGRLQRTLKKDAFQVTVDQAFDDVIGSCARVRLEKGEDTWIDKDMLNAYSRLHRMGFAHSVEAWRRGKLAGGLYGVSLGRSFFGESMFARVSNASKAALAGLVDHLKSASFHLIDCQVTTNHMTRLGAREIPRARFLKELEKSLQFPTLQGRWRFNPVET